MKWPNSLTLVRHGQSEYNILRAKKAADPLYQKFRTVFEIDHTHKRTRDLANQVREKYALGVSDYDTPLTQIGRDQAFTTGRELQKHIRTPEVIFVSPYLRTRTTFGEMVRGWPELGNAKIVYDDRIREQEHGLSLLYNDWRVFETLHPEQKELHDLLGRYWYQYPQGESVSEVRDRIRLFTDMLVREYAEQEVLLVTHHLTILSIRANLERLSAEEFIELDENNKPSNCGITTYVGNPTKGTGGKLILEHYNRCLWKQD